MWVRTFTNKLVNLQHARMIWAGYTDDFGEKLDKASGHKPCIWVEFSMPFTQDPNDKTVQVMLECIAVYDDEATAHQRLQSVYYQLLGRGMGIHLAHGKEKEAHGLPE